MGAASSGQEVTVTGTGWPATTALTIMVCGSGADAGTGACDVLGGQTMVTDPTGGFSTQLVVRLPPSPCPCTVHSSSAATGNELSTPIAIVGAPLVAPSDGTATTAPAPAGATTAADTPGPPTAGSADGVDPTWLIGAFTGAAALVVAALLLRRRRGRRIERPASAVGPPASVPLPTADPQPVDDAPPVDAPPVDASVPVTFTLPGASAARSVVLCGDFNGWSRTTTPLDRNGDTWTVTVSLVAGRSYRYQFLVDGRIWTTGTDGRLASPKPFEPWFATGHRRADRHRAGRRDGARAPVVRPRPSTCVCPSHRRDTSCQDTSAGKLGLLSRLGYSPVMRVENSGQ